MIKTDTHIFKGMRRDNHPLYQSKEYLWDALNIRFNSTDTASTNIDSKNTVLSTTNEKGTYYIGRVKGDYVGHCIVGSYLILFTHDKDGIDYINRCYFNSNIIQLNCEVLYKGNLNLDVKHPLQTISSFENEYVQKVYWVDGINQPRIINVTFDKLIGVTLDKEYNNGTYSYEDKEDDIIVHIPLYKEGVFDFVPKLELKEKVSFRHLQGGTFPSGTIQYAFTYYNKYGQESNIFYTSPILYIANIDRGGAPDEIINKAFEITIKNAETKFQYIRVYSILRTSQNGTPTVRRVIDVQIDNSNDITSSTLSNDIIITDTGTIGDVVDPTLLLFVGGKSIIANCMCSKDNTLFLGDITVNNPIIDSSTRKEIKDALTTELSSTGNSIKVLEGLRTIPINKEPKGYFYISQLNNTTSITTFKYNEYYRLGLQFQDDTGVWTDPVWIGDYKVSNYRPSLQDHTETTATETLSEDGTTIVSESQEVSNSLVDLSLPYLYINVSDILTSSLKEYYTKNNIVKVRGVVVYPSNYDKKILTQGVINPTVFSYKDRRTNSPFIQSSWFFRPMDYLVSNIGKDTKHLDKRSRASLPYDPIFNEIANSLSSCRDIYSGDSLRNDNTFLDYIDSVKDEVDGKPGPLSKKVISTSCNEYYVDQTFITLNSPELDNNIITSSINNQQYSLELIGIANIKTSNSYVNLQTSTSAPPNSIGFNTLNLNTHKITNKELLYYSVILDDYYDKDSKKTEIHPAYMDDTSKKSFNYGFIVYPWQTSGSINNDITRSDGSTQTAVLKSKTLSNISYANVQLFDVPYILPKGIGKVQLFNSNEISVVKLESLNYYNDNYKTINYYGNINTLVTGDDDITLRVSKGYKDNPDNGLGKFNSINESKFTLSNITEFLSTIGDYDKTLIKRNVPVRMAYKSSPHIVIPINPINDKPVVLPKSNNINKSISVKLYPFWDKHYLGDDKSKVDVSNNTRAVSTYALSNSTEVKVWIVVNIKNIDINKYRGENWVLDYLNDTYLLDVRDFGYILAPNFNCRNGEDAYKDLYKYKSNTKNHDYWEKVEYSNRPTSVVCVNTASPYCGFKYTDINVVRGYSHTDTIEITGRVDKDTDISDFPSTVFNDYYTYQENIVKDLDFNNSLYIAELEKSVYPENMFGGTSESALCQNVWLIAGDAVELKDDNTIDFINGDTYYQRYDCLKTYPFADNMENSVVEILCYMCETQLNLDGRYDRNKNLIDNTNVSPNNFNLINTAYTQSNNYFTYNILDEITYKSNIYSSQIVWSKPHNLLTDIDDCTNITLANSVDLEGAKGRVVSINKFNELLIAFQKDAITQLLFNSRVQLSPTDGVPIEIGNSQKMEGTRSISNKIGCNDKFSIKETSRGIYFIDNNTDTFYLFDKSINNLSTTKGCSWWFKEHHTNELWNYDNINSKIINYDNTNGDIYITITEKDSNGKYKNENTLCYSEQLESFTSRMSYSNCVMDVLDNKFISIAAVGVENNEKVPDEFKDYLNIYWNRHGEYNKFFNNYIFPELTFISNADPLNTKIFNTLEYQMDLISDYTGMYIPKHTFDWINAYNEYQETGKKDLTKLMKNTFFNDVSTKKQFRVWRGQLPRVGTLQRLRNPWVAINLGFKNLVQSEDYRDNTFKMILNNMTVKYTV